jgi:hypothetical protein
LSKSGSSWTHCAIASRSSSRARGAIATTPGIELTPEHVDVVMQRARESLRVCMGSAGFESRADAPGVFIELWECLESLRDTPEFAPAGDVHEL